MTSKDPSKARMERFAKISEKISQISKGSEASPPQKFERIEQKINDVEETFTTNIDSLEQKYTILKEQIAKFSKLIEDDKMSKDKLKNKNAEELKEFEEKIKGMMAEEREFLKNYVDNAVKKIEEMILYMSVH